MSGRFIMAKKCKYIIYTSSGSKIYCPNKLAALVNVLRIGNTNVEQIEKVEKK